mmetsp:Transcript_30161/g.46759  ORF Transcript_30161/g.46759 Transcript_30161/m.46759 type:complete len:96 (+) Transcript_30161:77-364(+)
MKVAFAGTNLSFEKGEHYLGRKDFEGDEKKISRKHFVLFINEWTVSIRQVGVNSIKIKRGSNQETFFFETGRPYLLFNGDELTLPGGKSFKAVIE